MNACVSEYEELLSQKSAEDLSEKDDKKREKEEKKEQKKDEKEQKKDEKEGQKVSGQEEGKGETAIKE